MQTEIKLSKYLVKLREFPFIKDESQILECKQSQNNFKNQNLQWHSSVRADDEGLESVSMISIPDSLFRTREQTEIFSECASLNSKTTKKADQSNQTKILTGRH